MAFIRPPPVYVILGANTARGRLQVGIIEAQESPFLLERAAHDRVRHGFPSFPVPIFSLVPLRTLA